MLARERVAVSTVLLGYALARGAQANDCGLEPPEIAERAPAVPAKPREERLVAPGPLVRRARLGALGAAGAGALRGKTVYVSAGHGWTYTSEGWRTQRPNTHGIVEDLVSAEAIDQDLAAYLRRMGAEVVPLREPDLRRELVLVDDDEAVFEGVEARAGGAGWGPVELPITSDAVRPFASGGTQLITATEGDAGGVAWTADVPVAGTYAVAIAYTQGPDRAPDAHYVVFHSGGESHLYVDQRRHGGRWVLLGRFHFAAGPARIELRSDSTTPGAMLSVDAVKLGGGEGLFDRGGGALARPMAEHCARYYAQWTGAPESVFAYRDDDHADDIGARARFAAWDHEDGEDAVYVAWHTNAPDPGTGTTSYTYGPSPPPGALSEFAGTSGSRELQDAVHAELVGDLRAGWDPAWPDRGRFTAYFGEVNPGHNPEMPAVLVEVAYHDTASDAAALKDPRFRRLAARAYAQGIARYFATRDGLPLVLPPEPPTAVRVENDGEGRLRVSWRPPAPDDAGGDPPAGYRVYLSPDGYGFDDGHDVEAEAFTVDGLEGAALRFVRVAATNDGGESLPSEVVGARLAVAGRPSILVVGGFDRFDAGLLPEEELPNLGAVKRLDLERVNDGSYAARHGQALADAGFAFDGATDEAVAAGDLDLAVYPAVDWFLGEESGDAPLTVDERAAITRLLAAGGRLFLSGAEIAWAMDHLGSADTRAFLEGTLRLAYASDDAGTYVVTALDGPFAGLAPFSFDDPLRGAYDADTPDVFTVADGARAVLAYGDGGGVAAATFGDPDAGGLVFGFPFETIEGRETRRDVMARVLAYFGVQPDPAADPGCTCRVAVHWVPGVPSGASVTLGLLLLLFRRKRGSR